jgi:hypothetical protein
MATPKKSFSPLQALAALFAVAAPIAVGCGGGEAVTGDEDNVVPNAAETLFDQARVCDAILKRHSTVRATDLKDGTIRWNCGDVAGVTDQDRGQEYCEYHAVAGGKVVQSVSEVAAGSKVQCVFTGVYKDTSGKDTKLKSAMALKTNMGMKPTETKIVRMEKGFNSRGAATALVTDCHDAYEQPLDEIRQAACYQASLVGGTKAKKLTTLCKGQDLSNEERWKKVVALGAKVAVVGDASYESQRDIAGCLRTHVASPATWRNSDPMICGRVVRAKSECGCDYNAIPSAVDGFTFTGWTNDQLPTGCRYAKVDSLDYKHIVICEVSEGEYEDLQTNGDWNADLQGFCHGRFSTELVMKAPIRAIETAGTCKQDAAFCKAYAGAAQ